MEVLLLEDIPGIGKKDDLLLVKDGYALNCLLPQRQALIATPTVRRRYAEQIRRRAEEKQMESTKQSDTAAAVSGKTIKFEKKITKTGKLYAAISEKHIAEALKKQHKIDVKESAVKIAEPIKTLGDFNISVKLGSNQEDVTVNVSEEK